MDNNAELFFMFDVIFTKIFKQYNVQTMPSNVFFPKNFPTKTTAISNNTCSPYITIIQQFIIRFDHYLLFTEIVVRSNSISLNKDDIEYVSLTIVSSIVSSTFIIERGIFFRSRYNLKNTFKVPFSNFSIVVRL